jgi:hypothetical protein
MDRVLLTIWKALDLVEAAGFQAEHLCRRDVAVRLREAEAVLTSALAVAASRSQNPSNSVERKPAHSGLSAQRSH